MVRQPMDLGTIESNLRDALYPTTAVGELCLEAFGADVRLVFDNAMAYNWEGSDIHEWAKQPKAEFGR